jgi:hypothetical protein
VSAAGFTGTHAHVLLEAAAAAPAVSAAPGGPALLVLSAHNPRALRATAERLHSFLLAGPDHGHAEVCRTLAVGRDLHPVRFAAVVRDRDDLLAHLARAAAEGPVPAAARACVAPYLPVLTAERVAAVLARISCGGLEDRVRAHAAALGESADGSDASWGLAYALGWIDLLHAVGLEITGARLGGPYRDLVADVIMHRLTAEQACAAWGVSKYHQYGRNGSLTAPIPARIPGGWAISPIGPDEWSIHPSHPGDPSAAQPGGVPLNTADLDAVGWLSLLADQLAGGARLRLAALWARPREGLRRLPPNAFTCRSYWPDEYRWS